jgi:hypothetical protein
MGTNGDETLKEFTETISSLVDEGNGSTYDDFDEDFDEEFEDYSEDEPSGGLEEEPDFEDEDDEDEYTSGSGEDEDEPEPFDMDMLSDEFMQRAMNGEMVDDGDGAYGDDDEDEYEEEDEDEPPVPAPKQAAVSPVGTHFRPAPRPYTHHFRPDDLMENSVRTDAVEPDITAGRIPDTEEADIQNNFVEAVKRGDEEYGRKKNPIELSEDIKDHPVLVEEDEAEEEKQKLITLINNIQYAFKTSVEAREVQMQPLTHVRKYKNHADIEKTIFKKPKVEKQGFKDQIVFFTIIAVLFSAYFGVKASTYYCTVNQTSDFFGLMIGVLSTEDMAISFSPFAAGVFLKVFLILAAVFVVAEIFIILDLDEKKRARVGKEHGSARLATSKDAKEFRNSMME